MIQVKDIEKKVKTLRERKRGDRLESENLLIFMVEFYGQLENQHDEMMEKCEKRIRILNEDKEKLGVTISTMRKKQLRIARDLRARLTDLASI